MASKKEENVLHENLGRCTRSGRRLAALPTVAASPSRTTRRSAKKLQEKQMLESSLDNVSNNGHNIAIVSNEPNTLEDNNSLIIEEMLTSAQDGIIIETMPDATIGQHSSMLPLQLTVDDIIVEEAEEDEQEGANDNDDDGHDKGMHCTDAIIEECHPYEDQQEPEEHLRRVDDEMELFESLPTEEENLPLAAISSDPGLDLEKSSSFPFETVGGNSETSEDIIDTHQLMLYPIQQHQEHQELHQKHHEPPLHHQHHANSLDNNGSVEISLLASLAGDNANSLPSVGGGESEGLSEDICKKDDFDSTVLLIENCEQMDSESESISEPAIAEQILGEDGAAIMSDATIINTELVSEDELPPLMLLKPEINDAEEVSDEELPAPKRAELPADAELISDDDDLPVKGIQSSGALLSSIRSEQQPVHEDPCSGSGGVVVLGKKRKCGDDTGNISPSNTSNNSVSASAEIDEIDRNYDEYERTQTKDKSEQYNPMSPTTESDDSIESAPVEKKAKFEDFSEVNDNKDDIKKEVHEQQAASAISVNAKDVVKEPEKVKEEKKERKHLPELDKLWNAVINDPTDFTGWTYLLQYVDNESDAEAAREAYDAFLSHYPYCYGYWRKYADYEKRKGLKINCNAVFERGLQAIPLSVDLWIHYLAYVKSNPQHKPAPEHEQFVRSQFERAVNACGLEFRSDKLWDAYIKWENESKSYKRIVSIYDRLLAIPTQGYSGHFDNLHDIINQHPINVTMSLVEIKQLRGESKEVNTSRAPATNTASLQTSSQTSSGISDVTSENSNLMNKSASGGEMMINNKPVPPPPPPTLPPPLPKDNSNSASAVEMDKVSKGSESVDDYIKTFTESECNEIKEKFISKRRKIHKNTATAVSCRWSFEEGIKRPYFHVKPLERCQLKNWKDYLDFEIEAGDFQRILVLFERCLIACALYEEFWLKMIRYLETQLNNSIGNISKQRNNNNTNDDHDANKSMDLSKIVDIIRDVYRRACEIHHPDKPSLHLMWAAFEECQNNYDKAADILSKLESRVPNVLQVAYRRVNVERRRGDYRKCKQLYEHYIETAKNKSIAGSLAIKYSRFLNKICHDLEGGMNVLRQALEKDAANTRVALQMIDLALQRSNVDEDEIIAIMDKFMARDNIDPEQRVLFAQRKVEFLEDFGRTAKGLQDAQRSLQTALAKASEAKMKRDSSPSRKISKDAAAGSSSLYNNVNASLSTGEGSEAAAAHAGSVGGGSGSAAAGQTATNYAYNSNNSTVAYYSQQQQQQQQGHHQQHNATASGSYPSQQSYDNYYNHWQYGSGYSGYGQWSGYSNYY